MILVTAEGFTRRRMPWTKDTAELKVSLAPAAMLIGEVRIDGKPLTDGWVQLSSNDKDNLNSTLDEAKGHFLFEMLPAGEYSLEVRSRNSKRLFAQQLILATGHSHTQVIVLPQDDAQNDGLK
ncbi:MAG TPA: hypothetical protein VGG64_29820 [Pirellulales bacterium]|jgi:hypothetical protein